MAGFDVKCSCGKKMKRIALNVEGKYIENEEHECPRCQAKVIIDHNEKKPTITLKGPMRAKIEY